MQVVTRYIVYVFGFSQSAGDTVHAAISEEGDTSEKPVAKKAEILTESDSKPVATDTTDSTSATDATADKGLIKFYLGLCTDSVGSIATD